MNVPYLVFEIARGGELFDFIKHSGALTEREARHYFRQLIDGLESMHNSGLVHRDLKLQNILIDHKMVLKIADFGFAAPLEGRNGKGFLTTSLGTPGYKAPEILAKQSYTGAQVDIFAAGVILFTIAARRLPFIDALSSDRCYKHIAENNFEQFWIETGVTHFGPELRHLITSMLQKNPVHRPSIAEIKAHPWVTNEDVPTLKEIEKVFGEKEQKSKIAAQNELDLDTIKEMTDAKFYAEQVVPAPRRRAYKSSG